MGKKRQHEEATTPAAEPASAEKIATPAADKSAAEKKMSKKRQREEAAAEPASTETAAKPTADKPASEKRKSKKRQREEATAPVVEPASTETTADKPASEKSKSKKRQREEATAPAAEPTSTETTVTPSADKPAAEKTEKKPIAPGSAKTRRYILFVGNLPFDVTVEDLKKHFTSAGDIAAARLMTDKKTKKSKGFAFVEFANLKSFTKGLAFHHSIFKNRQINVEMTAGGGGKSENRMQKLKDKNTKLMENRREVYEKHIAPTKKPKTEKTE